MNFVGTTFSFNTHINNGFSLLKFLKDLPSLVVTKGSENMKRRKMMMNMTRKWKTLLKMKENLRKKYPSTFERSLAMTEKSKTKEDLDK